MVARPTNADHSVTGRMNIDASEVENAVEEQSWYRTHQLVHYTRDPTTVSSILDNGFLLVPNGRGLIQKLLNTKQFAKREPQQFGMVSFTELQTAEAFHHRESFGDYGIAVSWEWALRQNAQRVIYLGDGTVMNAFAWLFQLAKQELQRKSPEPVAEFTLANRAAAGLYSQMYAHLLTLYEFMEPERNSSQVEWRIVNSLPHYMDLTDRAAMIEKLVRQAVTWKIGTIRVDPEDVTMLIAPRSKIRDLRSVIPSAFRGIPIAPVTMNKVASKFISVLGGLIDSASKRAAQRRSLSRVTNWESPCNPPATRISGLAITPDDLLERARVQIQYQSSDREFVKWEMPFVEGVRLHDYLHAALGDRKLAPIVELAIKTLRESRDH